MSYWDTRTAEARNPRQVEQKLLDGARLGRPDTGWTDPILALCGLVPVVDPGPPTPAPGDKITGRTVQLVAGTPTVVYTVGPKTQADLDAEAEQAAREADRASIIGAALQDVLDKMDRIEQTAATFAARPNATNNATAIALVNDLKNVVVPAIVAELAAAGRRDVKIVRLTVDGT